MQSGRIVKWRARFNYLRQIAANHEHIICLCENLTPNLTSEEHVRAVIELAPIAYSFLRYTAPRAIRVYTDLIYYIDVATRSGRLCDMQRRELADLCDLLECFKFPMHAHLNAIGEISRRIDKITAVDAMIGVIAAARGQPQGDPEAVLLQYGNALRTLLSLTPGVVYNVQDGVYEAEMTHEHIARAVFKWTRELDGLPQNDA